jgi:hypothetical protein
MKCLRNTDKNCTCTQITPDWEEYPACVAAKEWNYRLESSCAYLSKLKFCFTILSAQ